MSGWVGGWVYTPNRNDLKLGTVVAPQQSVEVYLLWVQLTRVIISTFLHPFISVEGMQLAAKFKFCAECTMGNYCLRIRNYAGIRRVSQNIIPRKKIHRHLHNALSNENVTWYFCDTSHNG